MQLRRIQLFISAAVLLFSFGQKAAAIDPEIRIKLTLDDGSVVEKRIWKELCARSV
jgi:hypothetical protein